MIYKSAEALRRDVRPPAEWALEALAEGRRDRLAWWIGYMSVGHQFLFMGYLYWIARIVSRIRSDHGEPVAREVLEEALRLLIAAPARAYREGREQEAARFFLSLWRVHMGGMTEPTETDRELIMLLAPCGTGGRILLEGWYEADPGSFGRFSDGTPAFCQGCRTMQEVFNDLAGRQVLEIRPDAARMGVCGFRLLKTSGSGQRLFSERDLSEATTPECSLALARLREGRLDGIEDLLRDHHRRWRPLHDFLNLWVTLLESAVLRRYGVECVSDLVAETYIRMWQSAYKLYGSLDDRTSLRLIAHTWHYHQATFRVEEEEDRFKFTLDPCGSGGRLFRGEMGDRAPRYGYGLSLADAPHPCTFFRKDFPIYCSHCALSNLDQFRGKPRIFVVDGHAMRDPRSPCVQYLYKKHAMERIPSSLLEQVGCRTLVPVKSEYAAL
ncbi:MAG: hypothetical protein AB1640_06175 [bacterium]